MTERPRNVLFLCTGNSARSIMAECALNRLGAGRLRGHSAGSHPKRAPHPLALELLRQLDHDVSGLRSKSWDEFAAPGAPVLDFVVSVCDDARGETCPVWPGRPIRAHWGVEDPAAFRGDAEQQRRVFRRAYDELESRIRAFASLPLDSPDRKSLERQLQAIGAARPGRRR
jgi:arsenate reductase